jgi:hypothetical protein
MKHHIDRGADNDFVDPAGWNRASYPHRNHDGTVLQRLAPSRNPPSPFHLNRGRIVWNFWRRMIRGCYIAQAYARRKPLAGARHRFFECDLRICKQTHRSPSLRHRNVELCLVSLAEGRHRHADNHLVTRLTLSSVACDGYALI